MKTNNYFSLLFALLVTGGLLVSCVQKTTTETRRIPGTTELRAPAYPLVTVDPYTSAWSETDTLYNSPIRHWTGKTHSLIGVIRVDGKVYRFMGKEEIPWVAILPMAKEERWSGKYTIETPANGWEKKNFSETGWKNGKAAFGTPEMPALSTPWETKDIWVRRDFQLPSKLPANDIYLIYSHDDNFELYLNGKKLVDTGYSWKNNVVLKLDKNLLVPGGQNVIAAHCHNRTGGAYVDFGLYRENNQLPVFAHTAFQNSVALSATQTCYRFTCGPVDLALQFVAPLLPKDLDLLSRPVDYINYQVSSKDGKKHQVQLYFEATPQWAVNDLSEEVHVSHGEAEGVSYLKAGTTAQPVLEKKGDDVRIDWGYFYLAAPKGEGTSMSIDDYVTAKNSFAQSGKLPAGNKTLTTTMTKQMPAMACARDLGTVSSVPSSGYVMVGYDDVKSVQYFGRDLQAWWKKDGTVNMDDALRMASKDHEAVTDSCTNFDNQLWKEAIQAGGKTYADLCVLAFRQSIAAHKLTRDSNGNILFLSKENFSNGSIGTVDVTYPSAPLFLKYNPELLKGMLNPIFYYSESGKWKKPFAAHDVGTYPKANGQTYGGDMPVEESGNMLILTTSIAKMEGNAEYAQKHWEVLSRWADYLLEKGFDPENQLCTDDFAGHFAHNVNLSAKAIMGIAGYGKLAEMLGKNDISEKYTKAAKRMARQWVKLADDGDHYRLTFDKPGTWSQKYNLVWDKLLELDIFPKEVAQKEVAYYLTRLNPYGLPLDSRRTYTKADWEVWTATLADNQEDFEKLIEGLHRFVMETPDRVPMSDWYETTDAKKVGFQARSVVGGYFIKMLEK